MSPGGSLRRLCAQPPAGVGAPCPHRRCVVCPPAFYCRVNAQAGGAGGRPRCHRVGARNPATATHACLAGRRRAHHAHAAVGPLAACFLPAFLLIGIVPVVVSLALPLATGTFGS